MAQDPFYLVRDDIQTSLDKAQSKFTRWQGIGKTHPDRKRLEAEVEDECKSIVWQVDEMENAVEVAEKNMQRFGLTAAEVNSRKKWVYTTRRQIDAILSSLETGKQIASSRTAGLDATSKLQAAQHQDNDRFLDGESDRQQLLMRQQDQELDELGAHVQRIGQIGLQVHEELDQQVVLLDELDEDVTSTSTRLKAAQKKINSVLQKAGMRGQLMIVVVLIVIILVLMLLSF